MPTPERHMAQGSLLDFYTNSRTLVLPMLTWSHFPLMLDFQRISFSCGPSSDSEMMTMLSACCCSQRHPVWNSVSITVMNSNGLWQEPWSTPHFHTAFFTQVASNTHSASDVFIHALNEKRPPLLKAKWGDALHWIIIFGIERFYAITIYDLIGIIQSLSVINFEASGPNHRKYPGSPVSTNNWYPISANSRL